jgi:hypothetical protein
MMHGYGHPGMGEHFLTGQNGYGGFGGFGGYGAFGDVNSDATTIYNQMVAGDNAGATQALIQLSTSQSPAYAAQVCQQMGTLAMQADAQAAAQSGTADQQSQNAVISVCQAAGVSTGNVPSGQVAQLYQQLKQGGAQAVIQALMGMDATTRSNTCLQMGQLAMQDDIAAATATSVAAFTNQNAVISACTAAGVSMPAPGTVPGPTPTPAPAAHAGMSTASILMLGVVGAGILYFVFK